MSQVSTNLRFSACLAWLSVAATLAIGCAVDSSSSLISGSKRASSPQPKVEQSGAQSTPSPLVESGKVRTLAGSTWRDGKGELAEFSEPQGVAVDSMGNAYVADKSNHRIRMIAPDGQVSTFAGDGQGLFRDGIGTTAQFNGPCGIAIDASGSIYVADTDNNAIRTIAKSGAVKTLAGNGSAGFNRVLKN